MPTNHKKCADSEYQNEKLDLNIILGVFLKISDKTCQVIDRTKSHKKNVLWLLLRKQ